MAVNLQLKAACSHYALVKTMGILLTLSHSEWPKVHRGLAILSAIGLSELPVLYMSTQCIADWLLTRHIKVLMTLTKQHNCWHADRHSIRIYNLPFHLHL